MVGRSDRNFFGGVGATAAGTFWYPGQHDAFTPLGSSSAFSAPTNMRVLLVTLTRQIAFTRVAVAIGTPTVGALGAVGLYDSNKNLLVDSGPFDLSLAAGVYGRNILQGTVTLTPGEYYFLQAANNASPVATTSITSSAAINAVYNSFVTRSGTVAQSYNGATLPTSFGAITPLSINFIMAMFSA